MTSFPSSSTVRNASGTFSSGTTVITTTVSDGWTIFTPTAPAGEGKTYSSGAGTRKIYVSSSTGNDSNAGTQAAPLATIATAYTFLRDGFADWMLLKKGDTFLNDLPGRITKSGASFTGTVGGNLSGAMLLGAYGSGNRPYLKTTAATVVGNTEAVFNNLLNGVGSHLAIAEWDMHCYTRDPGDAGYVPADTTVSNAGGLTFLYGVTNLLVEGCSFRFFSSALDLEPGTNAGTSTNIYIRRNQILNSYVAGTTSAGTRGGQGFFNSHLQGTVIFEENVFDTNGWNPNVTNAPPRNDNHNLYSAIPGNAVQIIRRNIFANDPGGAQARTGGTIYNNLLVRVAAGLVTGINATAMNYNVVQESGDIPAPNTTILGYGLELYSPQPNATVDHNIVGNGTSTGGQFGLQVDAPYSTTGTFTSGSTSITGVTDGAGSGNEFWPAGHPIAGPHIPAGTTIVSASGFSDNATTTGVIVISNPATGNATAESFNIYCLNATVSNNVIWKHAGGIVDGGTGTIQTNNCIDLAGTNSGQPGEPFFAPTRTIGTYDGTLGGPGTVDHFLQLARSNTKDTWNTAYTANGVNNYIRVGFGMPTQ